MVLQKVVNILALPGYLVALYGLVIGDSVFGVYAANSCPGKQWYSVKGTVETGAKKSVTTNPMMFYYLAKEVENDSKNDHKDNSLCYAPNNVLDSNYCSTPKIGKFHCRDGKIHLEGQISKDVFVKGNFAPLEPSWPVNTRMICPRPLLNGGYHPGPYGTFTMPNYPLPEEILTLENAKMKKDFGITYSSYGDVQGTEIQDLQVHDSLATIKVLRTSEKLTMLFTKTGNLFGGIQLVECEPAKETEV